MDASRLEWWRKNILALTALGDLLQFFWSSLQGDRDTKFMGVLHGTSVHIIHRFPSYKAGSLTFHWSISAANVSVTGGATRFSKTTPNLPALSTCAR